MEYREIRYLLKVIFFIKGQNVIDAIVLHDDAMNYVTPEW